MIYLLLCWKGICKKQKLRFRLSFKRCKNYKGVLSLTQYVYKKRKLWLLLNSYQIYSCSNISTNSNILVPSFNFATNIKLPMPSSSFFPALNCFWPVPIFFPFNCLWPVPIFFPAFKLIMPSSNIFTKIKLLPLGFNLLYSSICSVQLQVTPSFEYNSWFR